MPSRELPISLPKPAFVSMPAAVGAAIRAGNTLSDIRLDKWSETYGCEPEAIRQAWDRALSAASLQPSNAFETPEGK